MIQRYHGPLRRAVTGVTTVTGNLAEDLLELLSWDFERPDLENGLNLSGFYPLIDGLS